MPPIRLATTGTPVAKACSSACGTPSVRVEAWAKQSMVASRAGTSGRKPVKTTASESFASRASCSTQLRRIPSPTRRSVAPGRFSRTIAKACRSCGWPLEPRNIATEPMTGWPRPSSRAVSGARAPNGKDSRFTPAGIAMTRSGGTPTATTSRRMASPLVITRSASQR